MIVAHSLLKVKGFVRMRGVVLVFCYLVVYNGRVTQTDGRR